MDLEVIILSEISQTKTSIIQCHFYVKSKKKITNEYIYKTETCRHGKQTWLSVEKGEVGGRVDLGFGLDMYTLLYLKYSKDLLYRIGNSAQYFIIT